MKTEQLQHNKGSYSERNARYWKQNLAVCVFGSFTTAVSLTMLLPFLPIFVEELVIRQLMGGAIGAHFGMRSVFLATSAMTLIGAAVNWLCQRAVHEGKVKNPAVISPVKDPLTDAMSE